MATNLYLADSQDYITAETMDDAVTKYFQEKGLYPTTITLFKSSSFVITESTVVSATPAILPSLAESDGASVTPSTVAYIKVGDSITLTATPSAGYTTFVNWTVGGVEVSTANPYTYTATSDNVIITANFTA